MTREHGTRTRYVKGPAADGTPGRGCLCAPCTAAGAEYRDRRARLVAYGRWEYQADATGARRRIQALVWCGWSLARLSDRLGGDPSHARKILTAARVSAATERAVRALYDGLWDQPPPEDPYGRRAASRARAYAREHGFVPPLGWDEDPGSPHFIDDPAATPVPGWERGERRQHGALTEDAIELALQDEHPAMIAQRTGSDVKTVERVLARAGIPVWRAA